MIAENESNADELDGVKLLNAGDLAKRLRISLRQVHRLHKSGSVPRALRIGRCVRWHPDEIERWPQCGAPVRAEWESLQQTTQAVGDENT